MLNESDFRWHIRRANNIPSNPVDCEYCIVHHGNGTGKMYVVQPQYAQTPEGLVKSSEGYKYFVFFDCNVQLASAEGGDPFPSWSTYSGYAVTSKSFIAIFDNVEDAKKRAYTQYAHSFGYVLPHIVDDIDAATRNHFVVG